MKKIKYAVVWLLLMVIALSASGCTVVNPQYKFRVKGTYRLTTYNTANTTNGETTDRLETDGVVAYLIVTGKSTGYYIFKDNDTPVTKKSVSLRYEYSQDEPKKIAYVYYKIEGETDEKQLGVTRNGLNKSNKQLVLNQGLVTVERYSWKRECFLTNFWWVNIKMGTKYR